MVTMSSFIIREKNRFTNGKKKIKARIKFKEIGEEIYEDQTHFQGDAGSAYQEKAREYAKRRSEGVSIRCGLWQSEVVSNRRTRSKASFERRNVITDVGH